MTQQLLIWIAVGSLISIIFYFLWKLNNEQKETMVSSLDLLSGVFDAVVLVDHQGLIQYINPAAEQMLKYKLRSARGKRVEELFSLVDSKTRAVLTEFFNFSPTLSGKLLTECLLVGSGQKALSVEVALQARHNPADGLDEYLLVLRDLTESQALQTRLNYLETHDSLTRLLNRQSFEGHLRAALNEARYQEVRHIYCHLSVDQYRLINDEMGHNASDDMLIHVAGIIKQQLAHKDHYIMRIANNQFGVLLKTCIPSEGLRLMDQVRENIAIQNFGWGELDYQITVSIGVVLVYKNSANTRRIYAAADAACRVAREKGGNHLQLYRPNDKNIIKQRGHIHWAGQVRQAFKKNNFRLFAQPIQALNHTNYHTDNKPFFHYEILIRLQNEKGESVSPQEFIPAAEYYSMMPELDKWVIREVLQALQYINNIEPLPLFSINLSGQSLDEEGFLKYVLQQIEQANINPQMLCFEITETVAINNFQLAMEFVNTLKQLGCRFSLDDFGTGMSSFDYLKTLPVDYLKIDGSFIKDILSDDVQHTMVQSINQVGHLMGVETIAEYVESDEMIHALRQIGLDYGQGYGISKPMPLDDAIDHHCLGNH
ncbi:MAG: EAL domain-containing protein [bacterium]